MLRMSTGPRLVCYVTVDKSSSNTELWSDIKQQQRHALSPTNKNSSALSIILKSREHIEDNEQSERTDIRSTFVNAWMKKISP